MRRIALPLVLSSLIFACTDDGGAELLSIERGLFVLVGVAEDDTEEDAKWFRVSENGITLITQDMLDRRAAG